MVRVEAASPQGEFVVERIASGVRDACRRELHVCVCEGVCMRFCESE